MRRTSPGRTLEGRVTLFVLIGKTLETWHIDTASVRFLVGIGIRRAVSLLTYTNENFFVNGLLLNEWFMVNYLSVWMREGAPLKLSKKALLTSKLAHFSIRLQCMKLLNAVVQNSFPFLRDRQTIWARQPRPHVVIAYSSRCYSWIEKWKPLFDAKSFQGSFHVNVSRKFALRRWSKIIFVRMQPSSRRHLPVNSAVDSQFILSDKQSKLSRVMLTLSFSLSFLPPPPLSLNEALGFQNPAFPHSFIYLFSFCFFSIVFPALWNRTISFSVFVVERSGFCLPSSLELK